MDLTALPDFLELEREGGLEEVKQQLLRLAAQGHPVALLELSKNYLQESESHPSDGDSEISKALADEAVQTLEELADCGNALAMRHLAHVYLGDYVPWYDSEDVAEHWLLESFHAGCRSAGQDLAQFYHARHRDSGDL